MVKKMTMKLSMSSMVKAMLGNFMLPSSSCCSSSTVERMKVMVDTTTIDKEKMARPCASLLKHFNHGEKIVVELHKLFWAHLLKGYSMEN